MKPTRKRKEELLEPNTDMVDEKLGDFDVVVEGREMESSVAVVFLLVHDPRPGQLGQQRPHGTAWDHTSQVTQQRLHYF